MTEQEWLTSDDPVAMLDWLYQHHTPSDRKLRLAMCAMTRAVGDHATGLLRRVNLAEMWADGEIDREAVVADEPGEPTSWRGWVVAHHIPRDAIEWTSQSYKWVAPHVIREVFGNPFQQVTLPPGEKCEACAARLRWQETWCKVCRNTQHGPSPVLTPLVLQLAEAVYNVRTETGTLDNDALAVLSDALEDAGLEDKSQVCPRCIDGSGVRLGLYGEPPRVECHHCGGEGKLRFANPILAHLREPGPHYRGCWATDILLGKE